LHWANQRRSLVGNGDSADSSVGSRHTNNLSHFYDQAERFPENVTLQATAANNAWFAGDFQGARRFAQRADKLLPDHFRMLAILMDTHARDGDDYAVYQYATRLLQSARSEPVVRKILTFLFAPLYVMPGMRMRHNWAHAYSKLDAQWLDWARRFVAKYDAESGDRRE
jgi:hypothetical protein